MDENNNMSEEIQVTEKVSKHVGKGILIAGVMGVILLIYLGMSIFFTSHYFFNTTIAGVDYSLQNKESVQKKILEPNASFTVTLKGRNDVTDSFSTQNLGMSYVFDDSLEKINESQNVYLWPLSLFKDNEYELSVYVSYDREQLEKEITSLSLFDSNNCKKPSDAHIGAFDEEKGKYDIVIEDKGSELQIDKTLDCVENAFTTIAFGQDEVIIDLDEQNCYLSPLINSDNTALHDTLEKVNTYVSTNISYDWNEQTEVIDGALISNWIAVKGTEAVLDTEAVRTYVDILAKKNDTYGKNRSFQAISGNVLSLRGGAYGWKTDVEAETQALIEEIKKGETLKKEPIYQSKGRIKGQNDIGSSYIENNLSTQHLYLFEKGNIIFETAFVSGNMSNGCATPAGVFGLTYKTTEATLQGEDYESFVHYWMPFNGNVGMHDATWRSEFGGDIYLTNGSHGCVNLPLGSAEYLYNYVQEGFPIVCYYE